MGRDEMRAADADRQAVADRLKAALDEGRLDLGEYDERLQQAYAAKTYGDLEGLLTDLPVLADGGLAAGTPDHLTRRWLLHIWSSYVPVVGITTVIWLVSSIAAQDLLYFWPVWVAGPWGVLLIWQTVGGLAQREPQAWQAKIDKAERKKLAKKERKALGEPPEKVKKKSA